MRNDVEVGFRGGGVEVLCCLGLSEVARNYAIASFAFDVFCR